MYSIADMVSWIGAMVSRARSSTLRISSSDKTRCAPLPLVGRGWGWGSLLADATRGEICSGPHFLTNFLTCG